MYLVAGNGGEKPEVGEGEGGRADTTKAHEVVGTRVGSGQHTTGTSGSSCMQLASRNAQNCKMEGRELTWRSEEPEEG